MQLPPHFHILTLYGDANELQPHLHTLLDVECDEFKLTRNPKLNIVYFHYQNNSKILINIIAHIIENHIKDVTFKIAEVINSSDNRKRYNIIVDRYGNVTMTQ